MHRRKTLQDEESPSEDTARVVERRQSDDGAIPGRRVNWNEQKCFDSSLNMIFVNTVEIAESGISTAI